MAGPYRTRLVRPESFDAFWRGVEQRARLVRRLPRAVLALAFVPALAVPITTGWGQAARPHALARSVVSPMDEPFGLIVSRTSVRERRGALPPGVPRPDLEPGTVTIGALQRLTAGQVRRPLEACYERALSEQPSLGGDLVVSVAVGTEGEPHAIVSGPCGVVADSGVAPSLSVPPPVAAIQAAAPAATAMSASRTACARLAARPRRRDAE